MNLKGFNLYNQLWLNHKIKKPIVIFIGGYCGTGKSTFAKEVKNNLTESIVIPTGIIRSISMSFIKTNLINLHTYDLYQLTRDPKNIFKLYKKQVKLLYQPLKHIADFAQTEMQNYIIEGNHVFPDFFKKFKEDNYISVFFKCSDEIQFIKNLSGDNHPRMLNQDQITTAKMLNQKTIDEIIENHKEMFEYYEIEKAIKFIDSEITKKITLLI